VKLSTLNGQPSNTYIRAIKLPREMPYNAIEFFDPTKFTDDLWRFKAYPDSRGQNSENLYIDDVTCQTLEIKTVSTGNNGGYLNMVNRLQVLGTLAPSNTNSESKLNLVINVVNNLGGNGYYKVWVDFIPVVDGNNQYNFVEDLPPNLIELVAEGEITGNSIEINELMPTANQLGLSLGEEKYYRLRIAVSDENNISQNGFYQNGEVEDYQIKVSVPQTQNRTATDNQENNSLATKKDDSKNTIETDFNIFPNPAKDKLTILLEVQKPGPVTIELFDINGRKVYEIKKPNISKGHQLITLRNLRIASGEYMMSIQAGNVKRSEQVIFE
jgi:hypothetical protein